MPEPEEANQPEEKTGPDGPPRPSPPPRPAGAAAPKAIPRPSAASRDRPVPKPVRPKKSSRALTEAGPRPTGAPTGRVGGSGRPGGETRFGEGRLSETCTEARDADERERPSSGIVTRTTRPGITQAAKLGGGGRRSEREFTTHLHRGQDRANVREFVDVAYRFVLPNRPDLAQNVYSGRLVDISLTGAQLEGPVPEGVPSDDLTSGGAVLKAEMALPYVEGPLVVDAQLAWIRPGRVAGCAIGLDFVDLTDQQLNVIRAFLIGLQSPTRTKFRRGR